MTGKKKTTRKRATKKPATTKKRKKGPATRKRPARKSSKLPAPHHFRNRIVRYEENVDPKTIRRNPLNWRLHPEQQRSAMTDVLESVGFVDTCVANINTRTLIDGEMRLDIAEQNHDTVPVLWVDLTEEEERLALATFNPMSELAASDPDTLASLLAGVERSGGPMDELLGSLEQMAVTAIPKKTPGKKRAVEAPRGHTLRLVLSVPNIAMVERAVLMTGLANRGEAFVEICRTYLEAFDDGNDETRQHDATTQGGNSGELAQALADADIGL